MSPILRKLFLIDVFKYHKLKILLGVVFFAVIFVWIFPFSDLSDFVTDQVATQSRGQVFVQFGDLDIGLFPTLSIKGEDVLVDTAALPTLHIGEIRIWPALSSLLSSAKNPGEIPNFSLSASGLFGGNLTASVDSAKSPNKDIPMKDIEINGSRLNLKNLSRVAALPLKLEGQASMNGAVKLDPQFRLQPEGEMTLTGQNVRIPPGNVPTQMGPLFLPGFSWGQVQLKGRVSGGKFYVEQAVLGRPQDALYLQMKGQIDALMRPQGMSVGGFDLKMDLQINDSLSQELGPFLSFIDRFKRSSGTQSRYVFRAVSNQPGAPPNLLPLSNF
jgi:type II secretion system protein N